MAQLNTSLFTTDTFDYLGYYITLMKAYLLLFVYN